MRFHLNSRTPSALAALRAHLDAERAAYLRINFEKPDVPTTADERARLAKDGAIVAAEMARGIDAAVALAAGMGAGVLVHASIRGFAYEDERRAIEVSVEEAAA